MSKVTKKIMVKATPEELFEVITDFESYPDFLSSVSDATIVDERKNWTVVEFEADVIKKIHYTLELTASPPTSLAWELREGDFMKKNSGAWKLKAKGKETEATYEIDVEIKGLVPNFLVKGLVEESLPKTLNEFRERAEKGAKKRAKKSTSSRET